MSQVGLYVGSAITFAIAYGLYRYFSKEPRSFHAYFKLYCLAFGFVMPLYAAYEFVARQVLGGIGMSSLDQVTRTEQLSEPLTCSITLALLLWAYFIAIHRRFWRMSLWRAGALYVVAALVSYRVSFWLMYVRAPSAASACRGRHNNRLRLSSGGDLREVGLDPPRTRPAAGMRVLVQSVSNSARGMARKPMASMVGVKSLPSLSTNPHFAR